ncbi:hypothetical protein P7C70_g5139, partial [Phenoliferia sp. Uapishka_3]
MDVSKSERVEGGDSSVLSDRDRLAEVLVSRVAPRKRSRSARSVTTDSESSKASGSNEKDEDEQQLDEDGNVIPRPIFANADHRSYKPWIPEEDKQLADLLATSKPWDEIAKAFPWRTKVSVMNRLYKMDATGKGTLHPTTGRKRRVPAGIKRADHHIWTDEGIAQLTELATDRKLSWAEIGVLCGGLTGKTVEGKWRRMNKKGELKYSDLIASDFLHLNGLLSSAGSQGETSPSSTSSDLPAVHPVESSSTTVNTSSSPELDPKDSVDTTSEPPPKKAKAKRNPRSPVIDPSTSPKAKLALPSNATFYRSPAFIAAKKLSCVERDAAGWALPATASSGGD